MAKKKVNVNFLIAMTAVVGGMALAAFIGGVMLYQRHTSAAFIKRSADAEAQGKLPEAANFLSVAANKDPANKDLFMRAGDLFERCVAINPEYMGRAIQQYRRALELDPTYQPAIQHLLDGAVGQLHDGASGTAFYTELKRLADQGVFGDSKNPRYKIYSDVATVLQWMYSAARTDAATDRQIDELAKLAQDNPDIADGAYYVSQAQMRIAGAHRGDGDTDGFHALLDTILARHKAAVSARPDNAEVQWRSALVFDQLRGLDDRKDIRDQETDLLKSAVASARLSVKSTQPVYGDVQVLYAAWLKSQKAPVDQIEKVYHDWLAAQPHDPRARYELASFLGSAPATRVQAIALLAKPMEPDPQDRGYAILRLRNYERGTLLLLNNLRAQDAETLQGKQRDDMLGLIDTDMGKILSMSSVEDPYYLKLRGRVEMLRGKNVEAVKTLERTNVALGSQGNQIDLELWSLLEQVYIATGQTGTAQRMMEDLLNRAPNFTPVRINLAGLYLNTNQVDKARDQVAILQANPPQDAALAKPFEQLKLAVAVAGNDTKVVESLPETTPEQQLLKARAMAEAGRNAEAARLYHAVLDKTPAETATVTALVDLCMRQNNRTEAIQVLQQAIKADPKNELFPKLVDRVSVNGAEGYRQYQDALVDQIQDPLTRALRRASLATERGKYADAEKYLGDADAIAPNDPLTLPSHIRLLELERKFDQIGPWLDRAAKANTDKMGGMALRTRVALESGDAAAALKLGGDLVSNYGEFSGTWVLLGNAQLAAAQYPDALASFDQALRRQSNSLEAIKGKVSALDSIGEYSDEKAAIDQAMTLAPRDLSLRDLALNWELKHGDADVVVDKCKQLLIEEPENPAVYAALGQAALATAYSKYAGDPPAALQRLTLARDTLHAGMVKFGATADVLRFYPPMANALDALGDPKGAEEALLQFAAHPLMKDKPEPQRELAKLYERHGRLKNAEDAWRAAYASHKSVDTQIDLAQFLLRQSKTDDAMKILSEANAADPRVQNQRIEALLGAKRLDEAQKLVTEVYGASPSSAHGLFYHGLILLSREQISAAVDDLTAARDKDPRNPAFQLWLGRSLLKAGRTDQAVAQLEDILRRNALRDDVRVLLLDAYSHASPPRWDDFDRIVKEALVHPSLKVNFTWHQAYARGLADRGLFPAARQEIAAAQKLAPDSMAVRDELVDVLVKAKDWAGVLSETDQQIAAGYKPPLIYGKRGVAKAESGDKAGALTEFDTAIAAYRVSNNPSGIADILRSMAQVLTPADAFARIDQISDPVARGFVQVELYGRQNDWVHQVQTAQAILSGGAKLAPSQRTDLLHTSADAYLILKQWDGARRSLEELVQIHPDDIVSLNNLTYLIATVQNAPIDAKPYGKRAYDLAQTTGDSSIMDTYGWVLTQCGGNDLPQAVNILQHVVDSNQDFITARYHLAVAYLRQGGWQRAGEELAKVRQQMQQLEQNHRPVPDEIKVGVPKALEEVRQKSGQARG